MTPSNLLAWAASRLREPSTMAALASLLVAAGLNMDPGTLHNAAWIVAAICGAAGVFLTEKGTVPAAQVVADVLAQLTPQAAPAAPEAAPKATTMIAIIALFGCLGLAACQDGNLTPQAQVAIANLCQKDADLQPVAAAAATAAGGDAAKVAAVDSAVLHPLVQATCAAVKAPAK